MATEEQEQQIMDTLKTLKMPLDSAFIAKKTGISRHITEKLLLSMALSNKIKALETSRGYYFQPLND